MPFSNGTEYQCFQEHNCANCIHYEYDKKSDTYGCPLMDMFFLYSYNAKGDLRTVIDWLCDGKTCKMFKPLGALGQRRL